MIPSLVYCPCDTSQSSDATPNPSSNMALTAMQAFHTVIWSDKRRAGSCSCIIAASKAVRRVVLVY